MANSITIDTLKTILSKNAFKNESPPNIRIVPTTFDASNVTVEEEGWIRRPLGVGGPMAVALRSNNYLFRDSSTGAQKVLLREAITEAQNIAPSTLKGRKWPARRVAESLSNCQRSSESWNELTYASVCALHEIQILVIHTEKKQITFAPEDPRMWKRDIPIYMMSKDGAWIFSYSEDDDAWPASRIGVWLSERSTGGWAIAWPVAEGTMESLRDVLEEAGLAVEGRMRKEDLIKRVGHTQAVSLFSSWALQ